MCFSPQRRAIFRHLEQTKVVQTCGVLYILTFKCAFRHSGVQFFDIWTDKSAPKPSCFVHFDFQMCFSPQRRAIFRHLNSQKVLQTCRCFVHFDLRMCFSPQRRAIFRHLNRQKCSGAVMFCTFWLSNVLFATAACNFWCLLWAPTSAPAALTGLLLDWPDTRIIEKTQHFVTSLTFGADVSSFFWLSDYCIFCRLTWLLYYCFSTLHIVGSFYLNFLCDVYLWQYIGIYTCKYKSASNQK